MPDILRLAFTKSQFMFIFLQVYLLGVFSSYLVFSEKNVSEDITHFVERPGFQSQFGYHQIFSTVNRMFLIPLLAYFAPVCNGSDSPLLGHLLTSWPPVWQLSHSFQPLSIAWFFNTAKKFAMNKTIYSVIKRSSHRYLNEA